jgi:uncharacterized DUF497 family protein
MGKTIISEDNNFEWDEEKDALNKEKHGFCFSEILEVFDDPYLFEGFDWKHSQEEDRYFCIGCIKGVVLITTFYTEREERLRLISSRQANIIEQESYYDNIQESF